MNDYVLPDLFFLISTVIFLIALGLILPSFFGFDEVNFEDDFMANESQEIESNIPNKDKY